MTPFFLGAGAVLIVSCISLVGLFTLSLRLDLLKKILFLLIALAAGALLGDAFIHLIPEAFAEGAAEMVSFAVLAGVITFFILEKFLKWHHAHGEDEFSPDHARIHPVGNLVLVSDGVHNFIDGLAIGAAFIVSPEVGIATTIAIALHEIPQEIGDFGLLIHAGYSRVKALFLNFLSALIAFAGLALAFWIQATEASFVPLIAAFAAGNFIYLALADVVPELHKNNNWRQSVLQLCALLVGIAAMAFLLGLE